MSNTRTLEDIVNQLSIANESGTVLTVNDLRSLVSQASATYNGAAPGAVTLLYTGNVTEDVAAWQTANAIAAENPNQILTLSDA